MIGLESSLLMFPINLLIVQIFRNTRPRVTKEPDTGKWHRGSSSLAPSPQPVEDGLLTPEAVTQARPQPRWCGDALAWAELGVGTWLGAWQPCAVDSVSCQDSPTACTHVCIGTHMNTSTHVCTSTQVCIGTHMNTSTHVCTSTHADINAYVYTHSHVFVQIHVCMCTPTLSHTHAHRDTHIQTHTYAHIRTTHTF
uniref:Polycystin 1 like 2/pseudo n=1 Tax=Equus asinus TaxID=9793 RepID=A0A9L0JC70_EQUAS